MSTGAYSAVLNDARSIAQGAAELARHARSSALDIDTKSTSTDLVTTADLAVDGWIRSELARKFPSHDIITEESDPTARGAEWCWVVDPIDGTTNFVYALAPSAVSIGLCHRGEPVVGVVHEIFSDNVYYASSGQGAWFDGQQLNVGDRSVELGEALLATGFAYQPHSRARQFAALTHLGPRIRDIRRRGAASIDLCAVAHGIVDGFFERGLGIWDYTAATCIAREAGAIVSSIEGGPPEPGSVMAAPPALFDPLREAVLAAETYAQRLFEVHSPMDHSDGS